MNTDEHRSDSDIDALIAGDPQVLFRDVVEPLCDAFEPSCCDVYAELFSRIIARVVPGHEASELLARYERVRVSRQCSDDPHTVFVLSRVTLGADVAITSVVLDAAKKRFPKSRIVFVGPLKNFELFSGDDRIEHLNVPYARHGALAERLRAGFELSGALDIDGGIVIDPDSRITQLGLVPVCDPERYYFFESRAFGGDGAESLGVLTRRWVRVTFDTDGEAFIRPGCGPVHDEDGLVTVSFGVGENPAKRVGGNFEHDLIDHLVGRGLQLLIDQGAGGEEADRVQDAIAGAAPGRIRTWLGAFAPFAASIARSKLYVGYDSVGQHVAAACGVPLVTVFSGFPSRRMYDRWRPSGSGLIGIVPLEDQEPAEALARVVASLGIYI
jgi:ADP-heptose:LPS heptosyltransferase